MSRFVVCALSACLFMQFTAVGRAGKFNRILNVGDAAPQFDSLKGIDDKSRSIASFKSAKVLVIAFTCNHCPIAQAYEQRFIKLSRDFKKRGVEFVAISCSKLDIDNLDAMKAHAAEHGFNFPYLYDPEQTTGKAYGATSTPHVFVIGSDRKIAYMGAFDDNENADKVEENYVIDALTAVLAGKTPEITETRQRGCPIQYEK
ncbi:MAG: thioredoxin family protein [Planctomycetota bacterium]|nr:thioredoxin family protein [Planctomycetota bacterium]